MAEDIHGCRKKIENARMAIMEQYGECNGRLASDFFDALKMLNRSDARISFYAESLKRILAICNKPVNEWNKKNIHDIHLEIASCDWANSTKKDTLTTLRRIYHFAIHGNIADPKRDIKYDPRVAWIRPGEFQNRYCSLQAKDLVTFAQFVRLLQTAKKKGGRYVKQNLAMLYAIREGAYRPGELLNIKIGGLEFHRDFVRVSTHGKTGPKDLALVTTREPIKEWLEDHPDSANHDAYLFFSNYRSDRRYKIFLHAFNTIYKKSGISKRIYPYLLRHTALTDKSKTLGNVARVYGNWKKGSNMLAYYEHLADSDQEDAILRLHGLKKGRGRNQLYMIKCEKCGKRNNIDKSHCKGCSATVSEPKAAEEPEIDVLCKRLETLESMYMDQQKEMSEMKRKAKGGATPRSRKRA